MDNALVARDWLQRPQGQTRPKIKERGLQWLQYNRVASKEIPEVVDCDRLNEGATWEPRLY